MLNMKTRVHCKVQNDREPLFKPYDSFHVLIGYREGRFASDHVTM